MGERWLGEEPHAESHQAESVNSSEYPDGVGTLCAALRKMLFVDSTLVLEIVTYKGPNLTDQCIVSKFVAFVQKLAFQAGYPPAMVVVAVNGVGTADILERRRRAVYAHACAPGHTSGAWDISKALPGTKFMHCLMGALAVMKWTVSGGGGCCLITIAQMMREASDIFTLFTRERDSDALVALSSLPALMDWRVGNLRTYRRAEEACTSVTGSDRADKVVLDILMSGGSGGCRQGSLVQDLPGLPRMPGTYAAEAMQHAYNAWKFGYGHGDGDDFIKRLTRATGDGPGHFFRLDRSALLEMLTWYIEEVTGGENDDCTASADWSGVRWRTRHAEAHFPHGIQGASVSYLDAIDRELGHLSGVVLGDQTDSVYEHGSVPSALDLVNNTMHEMASQGRCPCNSRVSKWTPEMQLVAVLPRTDQTSQPGTIASGLHTRLELGCVHMFPVSYNIWWGVYPVIPTIDFALFEAGYRHMKSTVVD